MHTTEQLNAALAGRYAIERRIGEGGMAVVYLARDSKHDRKVAVKVLKPELGAVLGVERFLSEIRVTANLQHPNLLPLFDSGEAGGLLFYVMPFVEGESLRARLERELQLPIAEAVRIAVAVASALAYAHERGVIHRDLKPENILLQSGQPVVADFGIALAVSNAGGARVTQTGLSLGTPQYMSPEQATGDRAIDARSDIYSLAAMTYEMIAGEPPHTGPNAQAIMAKLLTVDPAPLSSVRKSAPAHVEAALMRGLAKVPADRFANAADFAAALDGSRAVTAPATAGSRYPATVRRLGRREVSAWITALAGISIASWLSTRPSIEPPVRRFSIQMPDSFEAGGSPITSMYSLAVSPDGQNFAFVGRKNLRYKIFIRRADATEPREVAGADQGGRPVFSSDGRTLLFLSERQELFSVPVVGGVPKKLADSVNSMSWGDDATIYVTDRTEKVYAIPSNGGPRRLVATLAETDRRLAAVEVLPGARLAYVAIRGRAAGAQSTIGLVDLRAGKIEDLQFSASTARYVRPGFMLYNNAAGALAAMRVRKDGRPIPNTEVTLAEDVASIDNSTLNAVLDFASSQDGSIVYRPGANDPMPPTSVIMVERGGARKAIRADGKRYDELVVSPDGKRAIVRVGAKDFMTGDLWVLDLTSGGFTPLTRGNNSYRASWSRDGKRVFYLTGTPSSTTLHSIPWDGSGADSAVLTRPSLAEFEEGPRGGWSVIRTYGLRDILIVPTDSLATATPRPMIAGPANETAARVSPNGRLLAYQSDQSGQREVYVTPLPGPGPRVPVSVGLGRDPRWSLDGTKVYFRTESSLRVAAVTERPELTVAKSQVILDGGLPDIDDPMYALLPTGGFIITQGATARRLTTSLRVITDFPTLFTTSSAQATVRP